MTPWPWWGELTAYLLLIALGTGYLFLTDHLRQRRIAAARRRENAATLAWIEMQAELDAAKAEGRTVLRAVSDTPIFEGLATERLRDDLGRWGA